MNKTNFVLDATIFTAFLIAMEPRIASIAVHEWLAVTLAATVVAHLLLHWTWITGVAAQFFRKFWHTSRLKFVVDVLLFVAFVAVMLSGILISRVLLPALGITVQAGTGWREIHSVSADAAVLLLVLHFASNWSWVWDKFKKYVARPVHGLLRQPQLQPVVVREKRQQGS